MIVCKRCHGYINTSYREFFDPSCVNCGCTYPELGPSGKDTREPKGLRETIRYTGSIPYMKELLGYITYSRHPSKLSMSPKLTVECPMCTKEAEVLTAATNPSASPRNTNAVFVNGFKTAKQPIICPTGHNFKLKINEEGIYSWSE